MKVRLTFEQKEKLIKNYFDIMVNHDINNTVITITPNDNSDDMLSSVIKNEWNIPYDGYDGLYSLTLFVKNDGVPADVFKKIYNMFYRFVITKLKPIMTTDDVYHLIDEFVGPDNYKDIDEYRIYYYDFDTISITKVGSNRLKRS